VLFELITTVDEPAVKVPVCVHKGPVVDEFKVMVEAEPLASRVAPSLISNTPAVIL
jgi:hypothetical protein